MPGLLGLNFEFIDRDERSIDRSTDVFIVHFLRIFGLVNRLRQLFN